SYEAYKSQKSANFWGYVVTLTLLFANVFAIIQPAIDGDFKTTFWSLSGPVIFGIVAWIIYTRYEKRLASGKIAKVEDDEIDEDVVTE
ncbi:MAG: glutamate/gamma-aminobutyrate family transporter YjeM, partial [Pseudobutyrivibrio sp.]|nr:glutamate/gamma-aminobutyrate family transporter YjeM [Pseudobutyrivibrio sp.]